MAGLPLSVKEPQAPNPLCSSTLRKEQPYEPLLFSPEVGRIQVSLCSQCVICSESGNIFQQKQERFRVEHDSAERWSERPPFLTNPVLLQAMREKGLVPMIREGKEVR